MSTKEVPYLQNSKSLTAKALGENLKEAFKEEERNVESLLEEIKRREEDSLSQEEIDEINKDIDLYQELVLLFKEEGVEDMNLVHGGRISHERLKESPFSFQRHVLNRCLRLLCYYLQVLYQGEKKEELDTREIRYLLIDHGTPEEYRTNLKVVVKDLSTYIKDYLIPFKEKIGERDGTKDEIVSH